jgi:hypothetical protein
MRAGLYGSFPVTAQGQISPPASVPIWIWVAILSPCQPLTLLPSFLRTPREWS